MSSLPWWKRLPERLLSEDAALAKLNSDSPEHFTGHRWVRVGDQAEPRIRAMIAVASKTLELEVSFPPHYPEGCPTVRPIPYEKPISSHQYVKSGAFCLQLGPDNWHPCHTTADLLRSTWLLLAMETINEFEPMDIPSRDRFDLRERITRAGFVLVWTPTFAERLKVAQENCAFTYALPLRNFGRIIPLEFPKGNPLPDNPPAIKAMSANAGSFLRLPGGVPTDTPTARPEFDRFMQEHTGVSTVEGPTVILAEWPGGNSRGFFLGRDKVHPLVDYPPESDQTPRTPEAITSALCGKRVGIVGLGSLGSKVAVSLARAGVRRFLLVDNDIVEAPNVARHAGSFADLAAPKVDVVEELIKDVSESDPEVVTHRVSLGSATNPSLHSSIVEDLGNADVIIDATCNPEVFGLLAVIASDRKRSMVWGEVFGGGLGGMISSASPNFGPCPRCTRQGIIAELASWPPAPVKRSAIPYGGAEAEPLVASDADVSFIAAAMTKRTIDLALDERAGYSDAVIFGLRIGWVFETPYTSKHIRVRGDDFSCSRCWTMEDDATEDAARKAESLFLNDDVDHTPAA